MLTLYHAPNSRSSGIVALLYALDVMDQVDIQVVGIKRFDGSGGADPANPHPEGKVPLLVDGATEVWERGAIMTYLTEKFGRLSPQPGDTGRGSFLSWMAYYGSVIEPVIVFKRAGIDHPIAHLTFRGWPEVCARIEKSLADNPFLLGETWTAADLLIASAFTWDPSLVPDTPAIKDWIARCTAQPCLQKARAFDVSVS